jgi:hypothetical protein
LAIAGAGPAPAADSYYINDSILTYPGTVAYPPAIDATNFVNNSYFVINFTTIAFGTELFETSDTLNYTNNGFMVANTGFQFDTQSSTTGARRRAANFFNPGSISCGSVNNTGDVFLGLLGLLGYAQCVVNATNIANPGSVDVGEAGLIQFAGQNVDLSQSTLSLEGFGAVAAGNGLFDLNTNLWDPSIYLSANYAVSPPFAMPPFQLALFNSTPYMDIHQVGSNNIIRAVFIQDTSPSNVAYNVFFDTAGLQFGNGNVTIQWAGSYLDSASGNTYSNYLYLNDDYVLGASTNVLPVLGLPINFTFTSSSTPQFLPVSPTAPGFFNVFIPGGITNLFDVFSGQLTTGIGTNSVANLAITNLPGRVQISGDQNLDLTLAQITGQNYMSVVSTNQFHGSDGAFIQTPFADLNLGVTNGFLTASNTMEANIPSWGGTVVAWNTRWLEQDPATGATNDYRILIISSQFVPTITAQVQDLKLHGTNSLVVSDTFNIMRSLYLDAQSLTLTTNPPGNGATSLDGELNLESAGIFWQSSAPNLRFLTNNGAIRMQNLAYYGYPYLTNLTGGLHPATNIASFLSGSAFINNGIFMDQGSIMYAGNFESGGIISNGVGSFALQSLTTTLTNGILQAGGDVSIAAGALVTSNLVMQANRSLTLTATNLLTDTGPSPTNNNIWSVGSASVGYGISLPIKPAAGDLLGTSLTLSTPTNKTVANLWAGADYGLSIAGYTNNVAVGQLILNVAGSSSPGQNGVLTFKGAGVSNALYVDELVLTNFATQGNATNNYNFPWLKINTNMMIYYGRAVRLVNGQLFDVSEAIDYNSQLGANAGRLRWVYSYAGYYSSTNLVYTNTAGFIVTNTVNTALAESQVIDSDGDGIPNGSDPTPFLLPSALNFTASVTNLPPKSVMVQWSTIPKATNFVYYNTNLLATNGWLAFTNFRNWYYGNGVAVTNATHGNSFTSPQVYVSNPSLADNSQQTNVWVYDAVTNAPHFYKVIVWPNLLLNDTNAP